MKRVPPPALLLALGAALSATAGCGLAPVRGGAANAATEGVTVSTGPHSLRDVAPESGLGGYRWEIPGRRPLNVLQTIGNGCAFFDYDGDGNLDILLVGPKVALYRGDGKGKFADVSAETGVAALRGNFLGCAVGDYDADGFADVYLSAYRGGALLHNAGGKAFADATAAAGLPAIPWGTSAAFGDADGDGRLDLYVCDYAEFGPETVPQLCTERGVLTGCAPRYYDARKGKLFKGDGKGRFADVTDAVGLSLATGKGLGVAFADEQGTGRQSIAVADDGVPGDLFRPVSGWDGRGGAVRFRNYGALSGTAYARDGATHAGMGLDWGDYDNDGRFDLLVATFRDENKAVYRNEGGGVYAERSASLGLTPARPLVSFGAKWLDYDNDGWLDIALASGHVQDNIDKIDPAARYRQPTVLFRGEEGARFADATATLDPRARRPVVGRGLATGDYDNDGRVDMLVVDSEGTPLLLHNETPKPGNWFGATLVQPGRANRAAVGATVTVEAGGRRWVRRCAADGSYLSSSDPRVHVGIGGAGRADRVTVRWPDGAAETWRDLPAGRYLSLTRGGSYARKSNAMTSKEKTHVDVR